MSKQLKLCLAASGGGHLRQLFDLEPCWSAHDSFFVTEPLSLGESLSQKHRVHFVPHYAFGQIRLGSPFKMLRAMAVNFYRSYKILRAERPDIVITTGAAAVFWVAFLARFMGIRVIAIESFARFDGPSMFGRLIRKRADDLVVQSAKLKEIWPEAHFFDPFRILPGDPPKKQQLTFATVGATLPFDRMMDAVFAARKAGALPGRLIVQTGETSREWSGEAETDVQIVRSLPFDEVQKILIDADIVITHGGTGSIITALRQGCRVITMPRRPDLGEHYDNHQVEISEAFRDRGLLDLALGADDLVEVIAKARSRTPIMATTQPDALIHWLNGVTADVAAKS